MIGWLRQHRQALGAALRRFGPSGGPLGALVIGVALALPAGGYSLLEAARELGARVTLDPQLSVFMRVDARRADADAVRAALRADARVANHRFVSRDDALKDLQTVQGLSDVVAALGSNPLPDAFVVVARDPAAVEPLGAELAKLPGVGHVQADGLWARRLGSLARLGRFGVLLLTAILGVGLVAVTFSTVRMQVLTQRAEIEVSRLLGATDGYIRRPFYYLGLLQGLAGGLVALGIVAGALWLFNRELAPLAQSYGSDFRLPFLSLDDAAAVVLFAGMIGWLGASVSVNQQLSRLDGGP